MAKSRSLRTNDVRLAQKTLYREKPFPRAENNTTRGDGTLKTTAERRAELWQQVVSLSKDGGNGLPINIKWAHNTKNPDIRWIIKNKPCKLVRDCGTPRRHFGLKRSHKRTTHIVAT